MATNTAKKTAPAVKAASETAAEAAPKEEKMRLKDIDPDQYVTVRNGFNGTLVYVSKKTGEVFEWSAFGDEQEIELRELKNAKNSAKGFYMNNWFMFDEDWDWVIDYLGVRQYYKNSVALEDVDALFRKDAKELEKILREVPRGQKRTLAYRAHQLIEDGTIDSRKAVDVLEKCLGVQLIER